TSRSEATTTEPGPEHGTTVRAQGSPRPTDQSKGERTPGATGTQQPGGKPVPLDKLFQERSHRPAHRRSTRKRLEDLQLFSEGAALRQGTRPSSGRRRPRSTRTATPAATRSWFSR